MIATTLNKIKLCKPCQSGWRRLLKNLGKTHTDDEILPFSTILESNGLEDTLWCCWAAPEHDQKWRLFCVWCARQVEHLMEDSSAIEVAERCTNKEDLSASRAIVLIASNAAELSISGGGTWAATRYAQQKKFLEIVS